MSPESAENRSVEWSPAEWQSELQDLRKQIDRLDQGLVLMREAEKLADIRRLCETHGLNAELVADILAQIMRETVRNHDKIRSDLAPER